VIICAYSDADLPKAGVYNVRIQRTSHVNPNLGLGFPHATDNRAFRIGNEVCIVEIFSLELD
jgi:hypothetical protein